MNHINSPDYGLFFQTLAAALPYILAVKKFCRLVCVPIPAHKVFATYISLKTQMLT